MQKELTINLSDETYRGLIELVGEKNASQFVEAVLQPYISKSKEEYSVEVPLNKGKRKIYILSPHLVNPSDADLLKVEVIKEDSNA